ncbi:MAG: SGNH/GDSL hydrolase family protein [Gammaproteobacteria bacterium]|nr:SGNH/GDSL hydrolase family protein [Gammaproteobacteria bacterium]
MEISEQKNSLAKTKRSSFSLLAISLLLTALASNPFTFAQEQNDPRWVTTWSASPSTLPGEDDPDNSPLGQTLRLIVHSSVGGSSVRIRLSNAHGNQAITIGAASIALQSSGSSIQPSTSKPLEFAGQSWVSIPKGAIVFSDPLNYDLPEMTNLSVSLYLPEDSGFLTAHALSNQTNYVSSDSDQTSSMDLSNRTETAAWPLLTAIDVINSNSFSAVVVVGDSITDGWGSTLSANQRWPNHFTRRLFADSSARKYAIVNAGISGNRVTSEGNSLFGQNLQARFERDVLALSNVTHIVLMEGINDIGMSPSGDLISAAEVIAGYRQVIARAHAHGIQVIGATLTPYEGAAYFTAEGELVRQNINAFIRSGGEFDGVIDFEKALQDPANPSRILTEFTTDHLHPNDAGYAAMANIIEIALFD